MICVTIAPVSRKLAKADLLNAARLGDIVELRLDHLAKEPDVRDLIAGAPKPVIISCRRPQDGGAWAGSEEARLRLLRQAIVAGPAYVELDLEIAPRIPRFGETQRIISFTRMDRPEADIEEVFNQAAAHQADVVRFTWPTPTMDDAWPLLLAISQKRRLPIVGVGLGRADLTISLLGRKYGSPWIYAALERGMETYPGQATVFELDEVYHWRQIGPQTTFVAIAGFGPAQEMTTRIMNAGFQQLGEDVRCLPIEVGEVQRLCPMLDALKIRAVVVSHRLCRTLRPLADVIDDALDAIDLLRKKADEQWHGTSMLTQCTLSALETHCRSTSRPDSAPLAGRNVLVLGTAGIASALIRALEERQALVSVCAPRDADAQQTASQQGCRFVPFQNVYSTLADVLVIADPELKCGAAHGSLNPSLLRPGMIVLDVSDPPLEHALFCEARERDCGLIEPEAIFAAQLSLQFKSIIRRELPLSAVQQGLLSD